MFLILILALTIGGASANEFNDFTNNLATDLGPLLALFGEEMTKQYLSESIKFTDYVIFAMAPIGIITAIASVIRVCGNNALRAFIGRAQEADGAIEAQLCTSTSRDVCELFNQAGITRVLGRPRVLELVFYPNDAKKKEAHMGIHIFQHHLIKSEGEWSRKKVYRVYRESYLHTAWCKAKSVLPGRWSAKPKPKSADVEATVATEIDEKSTRTTMQRTMPQDAPIAGQLDSSSAEKTSSTSRPDGAYPNLSLNVGIVKLRPWVFYAVAAIGVTLQFGVMVMAGLVAWKAGWTSNGEVAAFAYNKSPLIFIVGTAAMCGGMLLCAALIGEATDEVTYDRTPPEQSKSPSHLLWLQPGDQVIGDQSFDAYAYFEDSSKPLSSYVTSRKYKNPKSRFHFYTWFAVIVTMGGYIAQFIGVRGMSAYVSIAQIFSTIIMTFLRGFLRARRISKKDNQLVDMPTLVPGHELDWLAFKIWNKIPKDSVHADQRGSPKDAMDEKVDCPLIHVTSAKAPDRFDAETKNDAGPIPGQLEHGEEPQLSLNNLILIRNRLAHLTGHYSPLAAPYLYTLPKWQDDQVKVRIKARQIADAICNAAAVYIAPNFVHNSFVLRFRIGKSAAHRMPTCTEVVELPLTRAGSGSGAWTVESSKLEAMLGLIMWSTLAQQIVEDGDGNKISNAEHLPNAQFLFVDGSEFALVRQDFAKRWMDANVRALLMTGTMALQNTNILNLSMLWYPDPLIGDIKLDGRKPRATYPNGRRFFGGNFHLNVAKSKSQSLQIAFVETTNDLMTQCAHNIYSILLESLVCQTGVNAGELIITQELGKISWTTTAIVDTTKHFVASGLGSTLDASLCVFSALVQSLCEDETTGYAILKTFTECHKPNSLYDPAMYEYSSYPLFWGAPNTSYRQLVPYEEYYLICYLEHLRSKKSRSVLDEIKRLRKERENCKEIRDVIDSYKYTVLGYESLEKRQEVLEKGGYWTHVLGYLTWCEIDATQLMKFDLSGIILNPHIPEFQQSAPVLGVLVSGLDPDKYLAGAVGFFAERGKAALLRVLLDFGAHPHGTLHEYDNDAPLVRAAGAGQIAAIDVLLRTAKISPRLSIPYISLEQAIERRQVPAVTRLLEDSRISKVKGLLTVIEASNMEILRLFLRDSSIVITEMVLSHAIQNKSSLEVVKLLLDDPRLDDPNGALFYAVCEHRSEVVKVLVENSRFNPFFPLHRQALKYAKSREYTDIVDLLRKAGVTSEE